MLFITGTLDAGRVGYVPRQPLEGAFRPGAVYDNGMLPYDSARGAGLGAEYLIGENLSGFVDFGFNRRMTLLSARVAKGSGRRCARHEGGG